MEKELEIWRKVNKTKTLEELAEIILSLADEDGKIQGRTRKFNAAIMAEACIKYRELFLNMQANVLTREFGIRQQAMYIVYYTSRQ